MKTLIFVAALIVSISVGWNVAIAADAKVIRWEVGCSVAETHWSPTALRWFAEELKQRTNGRLLLSVYSGGALGYKGVDVLDAVARNLAQMHEVWGAYVAGQERILELFELPQFVPWDWNFRTKLWDALYPMYDSLLAKKYKIHTLCMLQAEPRAIYTKPNAKSLAELKGLKLRTSGPVETEFTKALGAAPTYVDNNEQYTSLQQGVIDGVWTADTTTLASKLYEVTNYIFDVKNAGSGNFIFVNQKAFDELPADIKAIFKELEKPLTERMRAACLRSVTDSRNALVQHGMKVTVPVKGDLESMKTLAKPIIENWGTRLNAEQKPIYERAKSMIEQFSAGK
jgi:TRAP-type C4-dicarboxylate transport system substrate-binding protein